jgi:hypothetical protein
LIRNKIRTLIAIFAVTAAMTAGFTGSTVAAEQQPAAAQGSSCAYLYTLSGKGQIDICWTWTRSASGSSYYGSYWGTFYDTAPTDGRWVILQARWAGQNWTTVDSASAGGGIARDYSGLNSLNFRACATGGYCGSPAW